MPFWIPALAAATLGGLMSSQSDRMDTGDRVYSAKRAQEEELYRQQKAQQEAQARAAAEAAAKEQNRISRYNMGAAGLTPQELFSESERLLARDRGRFAGAPRPQYNGPMAAPMSALTQQAQGLRSQYANRPQPYEQKINTLLSRQPTGLDVNRLLNPQLAEQEQYGRNNLMETMHAQMGAATPQMDPFLANLGRIRGEVGDVSRGELGHLSNVAKELERKHNTSAIEGLRGLQSNVQARREAQIGTLNQMGNQKHAHGNMMIGGQRAQFEEEANAPYNRMNKLGGFLKHNSQNFGEEVHPDLQKPLSRELVQAMSAYGVDTSKPVSEWDNRRAVDNVYRGPRTAPLPPEVLASHNMMMGVTPRQEGPASDERRNLVAQLMSPESISEKAMQNIPEHIRPRIGDLRRTAQRTFGSNIAEINNRYIQANQPFSLQNTNAVQARGEEVARRLAQEEADILRQGTATQVGLSHDQALNNLSRLGEVGDQEQNQFRNSMKMVTDLNKQGTDKWRNNQNETEDIFQNYQQSSPWGFSPQMRNEAMNMGMQKGRDEMSAQMNNPAYVQSLDLNNPQLQLYGSRYDTLNKEKNNAAEQQRIASEQQARQALEAQLRQQQEAYQQQQRAHQQQLAAAQQAQQAAAQQAAQRAQPNARNPNMYYLEPNYIRSLVNSQLGAHPWRLEPEFSSRLYNPRMSNINQAIANNPGINALPFAEDQLHYLLDTTYPGFGSNVQVPPFQIPWKKG